MRRLTDSKSSIEFGSQQTLFNTQCTLNKGTDEELSCFGYTDSTGRKCLYYLLVVLSLGSLLLIVHWKPELICYLQKKQCSLFKAKYVLLRTMYGIMSVVKVQTMGEPIHGGYSGSYTRGTTNVRIADCSDDRTKLISSWTPRQEQTGIRYFDYQHTRYTWSQIKSTYIKLEDLSEGTSCFDLHERYKGWSDQQRASRLQLYGANTMDIEVPSYWALFVKEVLNPFYIFQIASIILWAVDEYYYYASCIFLISCMSIFISLRETRRQRVTLKSMVATDDGTMKVSLGTQDFVDRLDRDLVPGDLISIPPNGCVMTCDAVLTAGTCIVNESMLTGESVPVTKTPLIQQEDEEVYSPESHKRHTLFSGTRIVQTRYYGQAKVMAVVVRTGFNTTKGELVRAILFPKPLDFQFYRDAIRFILCLSVIASIGMAYSLANYIVKGEHADRIVLRVLDIVTIIVPPALPAAMTVGTVYAQSRLKKSKIFCISPPRINFCGRINVFCFDKTGTLTEDGLDLWGVVPVINESFQDPIRDPSTLNNGPLLICMAACHSLTIIDGQLSGDPLDLIMFNAINWYIEEPGADTQKFDTIMPTVVKPKNTSAFLAEEEEFEYLQHEFSLSMSLSGDHLRAHHQKRLLEEPRHPFEVGIIRQFPFSSASQRMSVLTRTMGDPHMEIYCKGAPEKIVTLCKPETVPEDFHSVLHSYTIQGFRVIALAYREMDSKVTWHQVQRITRDKVEKDLHFLGLLVMQNQLKPQTANVINILKEANIRTVMITGDMIQTAISVARNCGMVGRDEQVILANGYGPDKEDDARLEWEEAECPSLSESGSMVADTNLTTKPTGVMKREGTTICLLDDPPKQHLAINGKTFSIIINYFPELLPKICVQGTIFARMSPDQKCQLIEQLQQLDYTVGMCGDGANDCEALKAAHAGISLSEAEASVAAPFTSSVNNIECVVTAIREGRAALVTSFGCFKFMALYSFIQFISVLILYTERSNLSDFQFLYVDLVITVTVAILMGNTGAYGKIVNQIPPVSLVSLSNLLSIIAQVTLSIAFQLGGYFYLKEQSFYNSYSENCTTSTDPISSNTTESEEDEVKTWDTTVIFLLSSFMYIAVAFTFSKGPPFRKPIYTNVAFLVILIVLFALSTIMLLYPWEPILEFFEMMPLDECSDMKFRLIVFGLALGFVVASCVLEWLIVDSGWLNCLFLKISQLRKEKPSKYSLLEKDIKSANWPNLKRVMVTASNRFVTASHRALH